MGLTPELDIRKGYGRQLRTLRSTRTHPATEETGLMSRSKEYSGGVTLPVYTVVFQDISVVEPQSPNERRKQTTNLIVYAQGPQREIPHALEAGTPHGSPVVRMQLRMVDDNLEGLVREPFTQRDVLVVQHGINEATGEYYWIELNYQVDPERPTIAQLMSGGITRQTSTVHTLGRGTVALSESDGDSTSGVKSICFGNPEALTLDELIAQGALPRIDWVATAGMYLTDEMPDGRDLNAQAIYESPVVIA